MTNRTRQLLVRQKLRAEATPQPLPAKLPALTADQRRELYGPRRASDAPKHLQGAEWVEGWKQTKRPKVVRVAKATAKGTAWGFGMLTAIAAGILAGETKRGLHS